MKRLLCYLCTGSIILAVCSCESGSEQKETRLPLVKTMVVEYDGQVEKIEYPGVVESEKEVTLAFKINGQLEQIIKEEGTQISEGDVVASLDKHDVEVQYAAAKAVYEQSKKEIERIKALYEAKTVSPNDYDKAIAAYKVAESKFNMAKDALDYTEITAPFCGFVSRVYKNEGETLSAGMPVLAMKSDREYHVDIYMTIEDFQRLETLQDANLTVGKSSVGIKIQAQSKHVTTGQLCKVSFEIPESFSSSLVAGMNVHVVLAFSKRNELFSIPAVALFYKEGSSCVWKIDAGKACCVPVKVERVESDRIFVTGIHPGDKIAITGIHSLDEGQYIDEMEENSSTNIGGML